MCAKVFRSVPFVRGTAMPHDARFCLACAAARFDGSADAMPSQAWFRTIRSWGSQISVAKCFIVWRLFLALAALATPNLGG